MSTFISRADMPPNPPAPFLFDRPNDRADSAAISRLAYGSYAPGSPMSASSTCSRCDSDLNDEPWPLCSSTDDLAAWYDPGPGTSSSAFAYGSSRACDRVPKPAFDRLLLDTWLATRADTELSMWLSYAPGPISASVSDLISVKRFAWPRIPAAAFATEGSTAVAFGLYAPAPGVSALRVFARCTLPERNADDGCRSLLSCCGRFES
mmetsp:Transcript_36267/g.100093  ORF Transcript_36267/g.100093 Transcript_36267/m.100093 type:complete len:207 (-) Transcript_36267:351-971(-)